MLGAFGGRIDQTLSSIHNALKFAQTFPNIEIMLCDPNSLMIPLMPSLASPELSPDKSSSSFHRIVPSTKYELQDGCSLIPIHTPQRFIVS